MSTSSRGYDVMRAMLAAGLLAIGLAAPAQAQDKAANYPTRPVRVIIPYPPGGLSDMIARVIMAGVGEKLGQQFVIENRAGAGGAIGAGQVARAEPDGYTLVVSGAGSHLTAPLTQKVDYDPVKDFTHIAMLGGTADTFAVHPSVKATTFAELVKLAAATPGGLAYASSGPGTLTQMGFEYFRMKNGFNLRPVPYTGGGTALNDVLGGHLPGIFSWLGDLAKSGKLRSLAVSTEERIVPDPNTPTFREAGYDFVLVPWFALSGPKNLPPAIVDKLNTAVREAMKRPDVKERLEKQSVVIMDWDVPRVQRYFVDELKRWSEIAKYVNDHSPH